MVSAEPRATVTTAPNANVRPQNRCSWNDWRRWNANSRCFAVLLKRVSCVRIASGAPHRCRSNPSVFWWVRAFVVSEWSVWSLVRPQSRVFGVFPSRLARIAQVGRVRDLWRLRLLVVGDVVRVLSGETRFLCAGVGLLLDPSSRPRLVRRVCRRIASRRRAVDLVEGGALSGDVVVGAGDSCVADPLPFVLRQVWSLARFRCK